MKTVIAHGDCDGVICLSLFLKKFSPQRIYFTSATRLKDILASSLVGIEDLKELFVFDIAANKKTILLSSIYEKALWIDHHEWNLKEIPRNVEVFVDKALSSAQLVAKYFGIESELVGLANEIDVDQTKSEEAIFLRDLVAAIKWKYSAPSLNNKLKAVAKTLCLHGLEKLEQDKDVVKLINDYSVFVKKLEKEILNKTKIFETNGNKIAIYETMEQVPVYLVNRKLKEHEKAPFDFIAVIMHRANFLEKNITTKIELRTQTDKNVYKIASLLGGGGHKQASGATVEKFLDAEKVLEIIKSSIDSEHKFNLRK